MATPNRIRFTTVRDLYAAFPTAVVDVGIEDSDETSLAFVDRLTREKETRAALSYCAYLLARREAVWWACRCLRRTALREPHEIQCVEAAEAWVFEPDDARRFHALDVAARAPKSSAATWTAQAAGWSGGNISTLADYRIEPPSQGTAQAVRGAVLIAVAALPSERREAVQREWVDEALRYAAGDFGDA